MAAADLGVGVTDVGSMGPRSNQPKSREFAINTRLVHHRS
jgi:hypothetical protein